MGELATNPISLASNAIRKAFDRRAQHAAEAQRLLERWKNRPTTGTQLCFDWANESKTPKSCLRAETLAPWECEPDWAGNDKPADVVEVTLSYRTKTRSHKKDGQRAKKQEKRLIRTAKQRNRTNFRVESWSNSIPDTPGYWKFRFPGEAGKGTPAKFAIQSGRLAWVVGLSLICFADEIVPGKYEWTRWW